MEIVGQDCVELNNVATQCSSTLEETSGTVPSCSTQPHLAETLDTSVAELAKGWAHSFSKFDVEQYISKPIAA